jgi:hypothetical protein
LAAKQTAMAPSLADAVVNPVNVTGIGFTAHLDPVDGGYKISVNVDPRNLSIDQKDGKWTGMLQFLVVVGKVEQLTTVPLSLVWVFGSLWIVYSYSSSASVDLAGLPRVSLL